MCVGRYAAKVMRNERSEMEHNLSEMPAYTHQIPNGISSHLLRDNLYIIAINFWKKYYVV